MKKKHPKARCVVCGVNREALEGKTMPGLYKGKCHKCYVLKRRYGPLTKLVRTKITLERMVHAIA